MKATEPVSPSAPPFLVKVGADVGGGAVAVVGQRLDDDGDAARAVALVADLLVVLGVAARGLLDGALDIVLRHRLRPWRSAPPGAGAGSSPGRACPLLAATVISRASLENIFDAHRVLAALAVHDVLELRMAGHGVPCLSKIASVGMAGLIDKSAENVQTQALWRHGSRKRDAGAAASDLEATPALSLTVEARRQRRRLPMTPACASSPLLPLPSPARPRRLAAAQTSCRAAAWRSRRRCRRSPTPRFDAGTGAVGGRR